MAEEEEEEEEERNRSPLYKGYGSRPVPDPTVLTTQALEREVANLKEMILREMTAMRLSIETRFAGMDEATKLLRERQEKVPSETDKAITTLRALMDEKFVSISGLMSEKFDSVAKQFVERDVRTESQQRDGKVAVDAALQAAKEAVGAQNESNATAIAKSEAATIKQIDQIGVLIMNGQKATDDKIDDLKGRMSLVEGRMVGGDRAVHTAEYAGTHQQASTQNYTTIAAILVSAIIALAALFYRPAAPAPEYGRSPLIYPETGSPSNSTITTPLGPGSTVIPAPAH